MSPKCSIFPTVYVLLKLTAFYLLYFIFRSRNNGGQQQLSNNKEVDLQKKLYLAVNGRQSGKLATQSNERSPLMMKQSVDEEQIKRCSDSNAPIGIGFVPSINTQDPAAGKSVKENEIM